MDIQLTLTTLVIISSLIVLLIRICKSFKNEPQSDINLPASPSKFPVIGHLHHMVGELPHRAFARLSKQYGPVMRLQLGELTVVVITSPEAAKEVLKVQDTACADRPNSIAVSVMSYNGMDIAYSPYNEYWRQMRKIWILELLSAKSVKLFGHIRQSEMSRLVESLRHSSALGEAVDLSKMAQGLMSKIICRCAFGKLSKDNDEFADLVTKWLGMASGFAMADLFPSSKLLNLLTPKKHKLLRMRRRLSAIIDDILEEHMLKRSGKQGSEDIVDVLLRMQKNQELQFPITNDTIKATIFDMFTAGSETAATTLTWAMTELLSNPEVMAKAQREIRECFKEKTRVEEEDIQAQGQEGLKYLKLVIKETLRLHTPVPMAPRQCREECKVHGHTIPLKAKVMINIWALSRDPTLWDDPETFRPERFENSTLDFSGNSDFQYIPFGAGKRICPGINFGLAKVENSLFQLLYHFDWKLPPGYIVDMTEKEGITVGKKHPLLAIPTLRAT